MKYNRNLNIGIFALIIILSFYGCGQNILETKTYNDSIVFIYSDNNNGNGVVYKQEKFGTLIATAAHVVIGENKIEILDSKGKKWNAEKIYESTTADLAFLLVDEEQNGNWFMINEDKSAKDQLKKGDDFFLLTYNQEKNEIESTEGWVMEPWIYMEDFRSHMLWGKLNASPGMSGGGIFSTDEVFLGILCGGTMENEVAILPQNVIEGEYRLMINNREEGV